jgi:hypothetical protein
MVTPSKVAAVATAAVLVMTPTAALAAKPPHRSAARTCAALEKKEGAKRFDARFGTGKKHTGAMARCIRTHTKPATKKKKS